MTINKMRLALAGAMLAALSIPGAFAQNVGDSDPMNGAVSEETTITGDEESMPDIAALAAMLDAPDSGVFLALQGEPPFPPSPPAPGDAANVRVHEGPGEGRQAWHRDMRGGGGPFGVLHGPLALTDDQWEKLYAIKTSTSDAMAPKKTAMHQAMRDMVGAMAAENPDSGRIKNLQSQIAGLRSDMSMAESNKLLAMSQVLTPDQRKAIHMMMVKGAVCGHMHGGMRHGPHH